MQRGRKRARRMQRMWTPSEAGKHMLKCAGCGDSVHKKEECSKIKRNRRERINLDKWNCMKCANPERYLREQEKEKRRMEETETKEKKKCNICRKAIRANKNDQACLRCTRCKKDVHLKQECSGETREATKKLDREKWICITCTEIEEEQGKRRTGRRSDEGETRGMEYITSGKTSKQRSECYSGMRIRSCQRRMSSRQS